MKTLFKYLTVILLTLFTNDSFSQIIPTPCINNTFNINSTMSFYDAGGIGGDTCSNGITGNYPNSGCVTSMLFTAPVGQQLEFDFDYASMYNTSVGWDWLVIYDGPNITSPILFDNRAAGPNNDGRASNFPDTGCTVFNIPKFCSTNEEVLIQFNATSVVNRAGWEATVGLCDTIMPLVLTRFGGSCTELSWTTSTEDNTDYFILQQSSNGIVWEDIARVEAYLSPSTYTQEIIPYYSTTYYRLKQVDLNNLIDYSKTIALTCDVQQIEEIEGVYNAVGQYMGEDIPHDPGFYLIIYKNNTARKIIQL